MRAANPGRRRAALRAASIALGLLFVVRPLTGVDVLLVVTIAALALGGAHRAVASRRARERVAGALLVTVAGVLALEPVWGVRALVATAATASAAAGAFLLTRRGWAPRATGVGSALLGVAAVLCPDVAQIVIPVAVGLVLLVVGLRPIVPTPPPAVTAVLVAVLGIAALGYTAYVAVEAPRPDGFYSAPTRTVHSPGLLLRAEPFETDVPAGVRAWRILYSTTLMPERPTVASAIVAVPADRLTARPPVVAWAHGTTGLRRHCAPSLRSRHTVGAGGIAAVHGALARGWAVVAPDYPGLGTGGVHPYLIGSGEARSVLDAVRAARRLPDVDLGRRTTVWGHSQGGHAALWTGMTQPEYAPDVRLSGVAAVAPVSRPAVFLRDLQRRPVGTIFVAYALAAYDATYDDVTASAHVRAAARTPLARIADRCLRAATSELSLAQARIMADRFVKESLFEGGLGRRLSENDATGVIRAPLLVAQGTSDRVVTRRLQDTYVRDRCVAGQSLDYRTFDGRGHGDLLRDGSPFVAELLDWTADRFASRPSTSTC